METKYLSDGRKVAVIGQLNNIEFIVQEIFVTAVGDEIPSGERFTTKSLHDEPIESYKSREEKRIESRISALKSEIDKYENKLKSAKNDADTQAKILKQSKLTINNLMNDPDLDLLCDLLAGNIKWVVEPNDYRIEPPIPFEDSMGGDNWDSEVKLISMFGKSNGDIHYKINRYSDGSGNWKTVKFFRNDHELKEYLASEMNNRLDKLTHNEVNTLRAFIDIPISVIESVKTREANELEGLANKQISEIKSRLTKQLESINSLE